MDSAWLQGFQAGVMVGALIAVLVIVALMIAAKRWEQRQ
jgi:hypothetical protein